MEFQRNGKIIRVMLMFIWALGGAIGCGGNRPPNVVIIVMDTVRQDHLSCYGYERETTPNLTELSKVSTLYRNAHSESSWTLPSHASLFTGLYPIVHGATGEHMVLDQSAETLAEILSANGYQTVAVIANAMLNRQRGLDQGFSEYHETWRTVYNGRGKLFPGEPVRDNPPTNPGLGNKNLRPEVDENAYFQIEKTLRERDPDRPLFLVCNLIGAHSPYDSSGPFRDRFERDSTVEAASNTWPAYYAGETSFSDQELDHLIDLYDAEILHLDYIVGRIIQDLKDQEMWDSTLLIVTSDHGENFGDHGHVSHVFSLHESLTLIPLIIHWPKVFPPGTQDDSPVQLIDLFPTVLNIAKVDPASIPNQGVDLGTVAGRDTRPTFTEYYVPVENLAFMKNLFGEDLPALKKYSRRLRAIIDKDIKLIWASDGEHELYDLAKDPWESWNAFDSTAYAESKTTLMAKLEEYVKEFEAMGQPREGIPEEALDEETLKELKALGYLK